ncbi:GIY-YIG nuclease family protein [Aliikangiella coralliicola]|uniref:GIY-YIG nuclease family protein n=1 Tax=Aliikangiella coralliicola TaxID=2592383 RepID=UPI001FE99A5B|nr:GIY-YIG nuclease family protein [Aliikangiella coralliicola]
MSTTWYVYIIQSSDERLYTGITTDIQRRWSEHLNSKKGAKFFRGRKPKALLFIFQAENRSEASTVEAKIKRMKKADKINMINSPANEISIVQNILPVELLEK